MNGHNSAFRTADLNFVLRHMVNGTAGPYSNNLDFQGSVSTKISNGTYIGPRLYGKPHGFGRCSYPGGEIYVGEWKDGRMHGTFHKKVHLL